MDTTKIEEFIDIDFLFVNIYQKLSDYCQNNNIPFEDCVYMYASVFERFINLDTLERATAAFLIQNGDIKYILDEFPPLTLEEDKSMLHHLFITYYNAVEHDLYDTINCFNTFFFNYIERDEEYQTRCREMILEIDNIYDISVVHDFSCFVSFDDNDILMQYTKEGAFLFLDFMDNLLNILDLDLDKTSLTNYFYLLDADIFNQAAEKLKNNDQRQLWLSNYVKSQLSTITTNGVWIEPKVSHNARRRQIPSHLNVIK